MQKRLLLGLLLAITLNGRAQSANPAIWCPPGASWTYAYTLFAIQGTLTVRYVRDTLVAGQPAQLLTRQLGSTSPNSPSAPTNPIRLASMVTRVVANRVEVLAQGKFYTLYDFGAPVGSSWLTPRVVPSGPCPTEQVLVTVDSVGTQLIAGRTLRWLRVHLSTPTGAPVIGVWIGRIYEQLGNAAQYMQPQSPICLGTDPGYLGPLTAFRATGWPTIGYNGTMVTMLGTAPPRANMAFGVYPNPGTGLLTLTGPAILAPGATLRLLDLTGRLVWHGAVPASRQLVVPGLPAGAYTLLLLQPGQPSIAQRLAVH